MERTFVMIKPDAVGRRLCGEIIRRYEAKGLKLTGLKMQILSRTMAEKHYAEHVGREYYPTLMEFMTSGPTIQMVWEGVNAVAVVRKINGDTSGQDASVGTIRGDFGANMQKNLVHACDSTEMAEREIALCFHSDDLCDYTMPDAHWLAEK
ncbi:MAG TPA: nucleoside-diphosphate kinase [Candidatus Hydrogenedentes bacterium]|nr:nucleoside-diphosphate kinase [Candidatus Hydrogenedentota bacterium]